MVLQGARKLMAAPCDVILVIEYGDLWEFFGPAKLRTMVRELAEIDYSGFFLGDGMLLEIPTRTLLATPSARKFDPAYARKYSLTGHRAVWFDVLFVKRSSTVFHMLVADPRLIRASV